MNLYPRNPRNSRRGRPQEICMAHRILDRARKGQKVRDDLVEWSLSQTGDSKPLDPAELAHCVQNQRDLYAAADDVADWAQTHPVVVGVTA
jgi:hypothetical protein